MKAVLKEIVDSDGEVVTFVDELHTIVGAGGAEGAVDAGNMIKPMLARGELRMIGATTLDEYRKYVEKDPALERRFQQVYVGEPSVEDTVAILRGLKERYEVHHGVRIQDAALVAAAVLSHRYITGPPAPRQGHRPRSTRPRRGCASRSTRCRSRSTSSSAGSASSRSRRPRWPRRPTSSRSSRLAAIEEELAELAEERDAMVAHWQNEKDAIAEIRDLKEQLEHARTEAEKAEREGDLEPAAQLRYGTMRDLDTEIAEKTQRLDELQSEPADAEGGGRRGGRRRDRRQVDRHPREPAHGGRDGKLVRMEDVLHERVIGQDDAVSAVANAIRRSRAGPVRPQPPDRLVPVPRPHRRRQDRAGPHARRLPLRRRAGDGPHRHVGVPGEAQRVAPRRRAPGLRRLRGGRPAHRGGAAPARTRSCCSTRSRRPTPTCSTCCSSCSTTAASPTARVAPSTSPTPCSS